MTLFPDEISSRSSTRGRSPTATGTIFTPTDSVRYFVLSSNLPFWGPNDPVVSFVKRMIIYMKWWNQFVSYSEASCYLVSSIVIDQRTAVPEVEGSIPRRNQHSGSQNNRGECATYYLSSTNLREVFFYRRKTLDRSQGKSYDKKESWLISCQLIMASCSMVAPEVFIATL